jgi:hypothetical protein
MEERMKSAQHSAASRAAVLPPFAWLCLLSPAPSISLSLASSSLSLTLRALVDGLEGVEGSVGLRLDLSTVLVGQLSREEGGRAATARGTNGTRTTEGPHRREEEASDQLSTSTHATHAIHSITSWPCWEATRLAPPPADQTLSHPS